VSSSSDIVVPLNSLPPRAESYYLYWVKTKGVQFADNASQYITNRVVSASNTAGTNSLATAKTEASKLNKVLVIAEFIAASTQRLSMGTFGQQPKFIVLHKPGSIADIIARDPHNGGDDHRSNDGRHMFTSLIGLVNTFAAPPTRTTEGNDVGSTHFCTGIRGEIIQMADLADATQHVYRNMGVNNANSIGIEMEGATEELMTDPLYDATAKVICYLAKIYNSLGFVSKSGDQLFSSMIDKPVGERRIVLHSEQDPSHQKTDPGPLFNLNTLLGKCAYMWDNEQIPDKGWFKTDFDPCSTLKTAMQNLATTGSTSSPLLRADVEKMYNQVYSDYRALTMRNLTVAEKAIIAQDNAKKIIQYSLGNATGVVSLFNLATNMNIPLLEQRNYSAVTYDFAGGIWGDTKQV
jgi:N-acetyl-anhydromuramyl-L-alanine amidase AmpD